MLTHSTHADSLIRKRNPTQIDCQSSITKCGTNCTSTCLINESRTMNAATVCGAYTDANCTAKKQFFTDSLNISSITYTDRVALIAGLTSGLAVLILIAVVALLCYRKRRRQQSMTFKKETQAVNVPSVSLVLTPSSLSSSKHEKQVQKNEMILRRHRISFYI